MTLFQRREAWMVRVSLPSAIESLPRGGDESLIQQRVRFIKVAFAARQAFLQIGSNLSPRSVCVAIEWAKKIERRDDSPLPRPVSRLFQSPCLFMQTPLLEQHPLFQHDRFDGQLAAQNCGL